MLNFTFILRSGRVYECDNYITRPTHMVLHNVSSGGRDFDTVIIYPSDIEAIGTKEENFDDVPS